MPRSARVRNCSAGSAEISSANPDKVHTWDGPLVDQNCGCGIERCENRTIVSRRIFRFTRKCRIVRVAENLEVKVVSSVAPAQWRASGGGTRPVGRSEE